MKYPLKCKNVIDVTKAPYYADNTGKTDCTEALCRVLDDILIREIQGVKETYGKLEASETIPVYIGFESRNEKYGINVIFPEYVPSSKIIYFPAGTYLVSDTITYHLSDLKNVMRGEKFYELCRGIHLLGESMNEVVIRLADYAKGFGSGSKKPLISLNQAEECCERERTNVAQMNTVEDMTLDCGKGNPGAVGLRFSACNSGRVENVCFLAEEGHAALQIAYGAEGSFINLKAKGFDYGVDTVNSSICVFDCVQFQNCKKGAFLTRDGKIVMNNIQADPIPLFSFCEEGSGIYYCRNCDAKAVDDTRGNLVYTETEKITFAQIPVNVRSTDCKDYVCVDDFGAVGDGITDCTEAIQKAMNSGVPIVLFGEGHYLVNGEIKVPAVVKTIDFMFCDLFAGEQLRKTEGGALFCIEESSDELLFMENLYTFEQFYGRMRLIKHAAVRDLCLSDLHTQTAAMYFNTVQGSKVYLDNCACTTGSYSQNAIIAREGITPEYCDVIPYEFHGQEVYARQLNPERADMELLNDASKVYLDGFKVEGPGTAVKTINGGTTWLNILSAGIGYSNAENALFETIDSKLCLNLGREGTFDEFTRYQTIFEETSQGKTKKIMENELERVGKFGGRIHLYRTEGVQKNWKI